MLVDAKTIRAVVTELKTHYADHPANMPPLVCDPVCVSTSGHSLLQLEALETLIQELFPLASLVTPNKSEAELILSSGQNTLYRIDSLEDMVSAARDLLRLGARAVLVKGGHMTACLEDIDRIAQEHPTIDIVRDGLLGENMEILRVKRNDLTPRQLVVDVLHQDNGSIALFVRPRIESTSTHGTGCTLSAALACYLAQGANSSFSFSSFLLRFMLCSEGRHKSCLCVHSCRD